MIDAGIDEDPVAGARRVDRALDGAVVTARLRRAGHGAVLPLQTSSTPGPWLAAVAARGQSSTRRARLPRTGHALRFPRN